MDRDYLRELLCSLKNEEITIEDAIETLKKLPFEDLGYARVDHHRSLRKSQSEVVYCEGKEPEQVKGIVEALARSGENILLTRAGEEVRAILEDTGLPIDYYPSARLIVIRQREITAPCGCILVITAGTADIPVAEEAALTAEFMGNRVERLYDVGVAGVHRLLSYQDMLDMARVIVVAAGMDGVLPSVVGGLVDKPIIAVPTSIGYGASFSGLAALLTMLNSCASGIGVVNIDNGFGAGYLASTINRQSTLGQE
ncbi:MAG: nickel pincer cofactor biosynthesis protein LarB [Deltaproteobacteria bacterium]